MQMKRYIGQGPEEYWEQKLLSSPGSWGVPPSQQVDVFTNREAAWIPYLREIYIVMIVYKLISSPSLFRG